MHALGLLHTSLGSACPTIHARRLAVLVKATETLCQCAQLTLSGIGRALASRALVKHNIKRIDRLLGNPFLYAERVCLYEAMLRWLVADKQPIIVVDWSDLSADRRWQLLRAAVPLGGRTLTLYEEVHPLKHLGNRRVHRLFLKTLRSLLPAGVKPMIVTDAGFRSTWFELILAQGWSWVGRIRNRDYVCLAGTEAWAPCKTLYVGATARPQRLGPALMVRSKPIAAILHRVRRPKRRRVKKSVFGEPVRSAHSNKHAAREREPWLIASSCDLAEYSAKQIIAIYAKRMQIEEGFRDLKSTRYGLGFSAKAEPGCQAPGDSASTRCAGAVLAVVDRRKRPSPSVPLSIKLNATASRSFCRVSWDASDATITHNDWRTQYRFAPHTTTRGLAKATRKLILWGAVRV
jgi:hypothetical protein